MLGRVGRGAVPLGVSVDVYKLKLKVNLYIFDDDNCTQLLQKNPDGKNCCLPK
jgi:hypothetical protein